MHARIGAHTHTHTFFLYFQCWAQCVCAFNYFVLWPGQATCGGFGAGWRCVGGDERHDVVVVVKIQEKENGVQCVISCCKMWLNYAAVSASWLTDSQYSDGKRHNVWHFVSNEQSNTFPASFWGIISSFSPICCWSEAIQCPNQDLIYFYFLKSFEFLLNVWFKKHLIC